MSMQTRLLAIVAFALIATSAHAQPTSFTWVGGTDADWDDPSNWNPSDRGYPGEESGDSVTIPNVTTDPVLNVSPSHSLSNLAISIGGLLTMNGYSMAVTGATTVDGELVISTDSTLTQAQGSIMTVAGTVTVDGTLVLSKDSRLTLDGEIEFNDGCTMRIEEGAEFDIGSATATYNGGTFKLNGQICLKTCTSILDVQADLQFSIGPSSSSLNRVLKMQHDNAQIKIKAGKTLTIPQGITLRGRGKVTGLQVDNDLPGFTNRGAVIADMTGVLLFDSKVTLSGANTAVFRITNANATMRFTRGVDAIIGDFDVQSGLLDINASTVKADSFEMGCDATIEAGGTSFTYVGTAIGPCDPAIPASPIEGDFTCICP